MHVRVDQPGHQRFAGRVDRAQYWWFIAVCAVVILAAAIIDRILLTTLVGAIATLGLLLPMAGMSARRMQDTGRSGQIVWIWVIAVAVYGIVALLVSLGGILAGLAFIYFFFTIGWIINLVVLAVSVAIIYFCAQPGVTGGNAYGPPPPPWVPGATAL